MITAFSLPLSAIAFSTGKVARFCCGALFEVLWTLDIGWRRCSRCKRACSSATDRHYRREISCQIIMWNSSILLGLEMLSGRPVFVECRAINHRFTSFRLNLQQQNPKKIENKRRENKQTRILIPTNYRGWSDDGARCTKWVRRKVSHRPNWWCVYGVSQILNVNIIKLRMMLYAIRKVW